MLNARLQTASDSEDDIAEVSRHDMSLHIFSRNRQPIMLSRCEESALPSCIVAHLDSDRPSSLVSKSADNSDPAVMAPSVPLDKSVC
jgi:hypothetical protein